MAKNRHKPHRHKLPRRARRRVHPGAPPGTLVADPNAVPPTIHAMCYGPDEFHEENVADLARIPQLLKTHPVTWININGLGSTETIARLGEIFDLHPLALEDTINVHQRPKVEEYENHHYFVVTRMPKVPGALGETEQLSMFLGDSFLLTLQERHGDCLDPVRERTRKGGPRIRSGGPDYLAYAILDAVVDAYFPMAEAIQDQIESTEASILTDPDDSVLQELHDLKVLIDPLRRILLSVRDLFARLIRDDSAFVQKTTQVYLRDCHDHTLQLLDLFDSYQENCSHLMQLHLATSSNRMNAVMRTLTITATIFIPLTFVVGIYGMNFDPDASAWNMPELRAPFGYPVTMGVMLILGLGMLAAFRRRGWIGGRRRRKGQGSPDKS